MDMYNEDYNDDSFMCSFTVPPPPSHSCFFEDENIGDRTTAVAFAAENALAYAIPNNQGKIPKTENRYNKQGLANKDGISSIASAMNEAILEHRQDLHQSTRHFNTNSTSVSANCNTSLQNTNKISSNSESEPNYESYFAEDMPKVASSITAEKEENVIESNAEFVINHTSDYPHRHDDNNYANINSHTMGIFVRTRDNVDNNKRAIKKPYLKKGSRKEPSSLNRVKSESCANQHIDNNSMSTNQKYEQVKKENLQRLEQMQTHQLSMLQKRNERRLSFFPTQQKAKSSQEKQPKQNLQNSHNIQPTMKISAVTSKKNTREPLNVTKTESIVGQKQENEFKTSTNENHKGKSEEPLQNEASSLKSKIFGNDSQENETKKRGIRAAKAKKDEPEIPTKLIEEKKAFASQMKSMKKRQEAALLEAEQTRESTRAWAKSETEKMNLWLAEQRAIIQRERHKSFNKTLLSNVSSKTQKENMHNGEIKANNHNIKTYPINGRSDKRINNTSYSNLLKENQAFKATIQKMKLDKEELSRKQMTKNSYLMQQIEEQRAHIQKLENHIEQLQRELNSALEDHLNREQFESDYCDTQMNTSEEKKENTNKILHGNTNRIGKTSCDHDNSLAYDHTANENSQKITKSKIELEEEPTEYWLQRHLAAIGINRSNMAHKYQSTPTHSILPDNDDPQKSVKDKIENRERDCLENSAAFQTSFSTPYQRKEYNPSNYGGYDNLLPNSFHKSQNTTKPSTPQSSNHISCKDETNISTDQIVEDGHRVIKFKNNTVKEIFPNGETIVKYSNGDIKTTKSSEGKVKYYYSAVKTTHTTFADGLEIFEFPNQQTEYHYPDGRREISFPDSSRKIIHPNHNS